MLWKLKEFLAKESGEDIHWFSGINKHNVPVYLEYIEMFTKAVISQKQTNPKIHSYLIFDGERDEKIDFLENKLNVTIIPYRVSFYEKLKAHYGDNNIAAGAYLRCDIPLIVKDILQLPTKYVLYTDNDVLFMDDVTRLTRLRPKYFNISSEFSKWRYTDINSGVMWINVDSMYEIYPHFRDFIVENFARFETYDQDAIKLFFKRKMNTLDYRYNYKPYFGKRDDIKILHFHGPKPPHLQSCLDKTHPCMHLVNNFYFEMVEYYNNLNFNG
jgi:lipopolysaccharide biosynthesis glycosyltransferase